MTQSRRRTRPNSSSLPATSATARPITRRAFTVLAASAGLGGIRQGCALAQAPAIVRAEASRPAMPYGVASGDVQRDRAVIWSRADRPATMLVEYATTESFRDAKRLIGPAALEHGDFTSKIELAGLPPGQRIFYRVRFQDLADPNVYSQPVIGSFQTPGSDARDVFFAWSGDTAGQGFGINPDWGGMRIYEAMRGLAPDFFLHSGDCIYADNPIPAEIPLDDGTVWKNVVTAEKSKVAETLAEFRGNFAYNLLDENVRRFNAEVAQLVQWDDHETTNNWYPGEMLDDDRYTVKSCSLLAARARRAMFDYTPIRDSLRRPQRIYRAIEYGPLLDLFLLDLRSYRGPNSPNRQTRQSAATAWLGREQLAWLKRKLLASRATWKIIASDMPLGLVVRDGPDAFENAANGNGPPLGRELEIAELLGFIRDRSVRNVVWVTADVHYAAAHSYDPARARFTEFDPFWEFVAGPLHAGVFGPNELDDTFGPEVRFQNVAAGMKPNRPPTAGLLSFGTVRIDSRSRTMTVALHDALARRLYAVELEPRALKGQ